MQPNCVQAVSNAIGRSLSNADQRKIDDGIQKAMRDIARRDASAWRGKSADERLIEGATLAGQRLVAEQAKKAQRVALQILATSRIEAHLASFPGNRFDGLSRVIASHADTRGSFLPIEAQARAIEKDALRQMIDTLEATDARFFGLFENKEGVQALVREIFGEATGVPQAKAGAAEFRKIAESLRQRFNRGGGDVGQLDDWGMPHHHSQSRVAQAGKDAWVDATLPRLDRGRYLRDDGTPMDDAQVREFLGEAWVTIATGGVNKLEPGRGAGNGMRANRGNAERQIHYKSADDYMAYQEQFGERSLYEVMVGHIAGVSKDIALVETMGPNPDAAFRMMRDRAIQTETLANPTKAGKIEQRGQDVENLYNYVAGRTQPVASRRLAETFDTLRNWMTASRLGSAVISSFSDEATMYLSAHVNKLPPLQLFANELAALNPANPMEKRLAQRAGLGMNTLISSLNRWGNDSLTESFTSRVAGATLRASGLNALTDARRRAYGVTMMGSIGQITRDFDSLAKLEASDQRILKSKGITDADYAVWRAATLEDFGLGNDTMLTPESIYRIPDADLLAAGIDNPTAAREQAATRLLGTVLEETDIAIIEPGAKERTLMMSGLQRGTWKGELTRSFFLFKSFPISMLTRHWARGMDMPTGTGKAAYLATLMAGTTVLGMAALQVNEMLQGKDPRNMNPAEKGGSRNWIAAFLKGGSLGLYGDFLFSESSQYGQSALGAALGPVAGLAEDILKLTQGNVMEAAQGKETNAGAEVVKFVRSNTPGANLWYSKAALDRLVFHQLQEYFSPGYLRKMKRRADKEFGQSYWWEPGEVAPDRAPDLEKAVED
ncbi:hypothetical protein [Arenimonas alkanexedens]